MKKLTFIICLLLGFSYTIQAKERIIERPPFTGWNTPAVEIDKIVQSDTATVLHIQAYFRPRYWIDVPQTTYLVADNGEKYQIKAADGIPIGEKYYMPESGETSFRLIFPPLPDSVSAVDFIEETDNGFEVWGIQLKSKSLKLDLPKGATTHKVNKHAILPATTFTNGTALLKGQLLGYRKEAIKEITAIVGNPTDITDKKFTINEDGTFSTEIPAVATVLCALNIGTSGQIVECILAPGEETTVYINMYELCRQASRLRKEEAPSGKACYYGGYLAAVAEEYSDQKTMLDSDDGNTFKEIAGKDLIGIKDYFFEKYQKKIDQINALNTSDACKQMFRNQAASTVGMNLIMGKNFLVQSLLENNKLKREEASEYYMKLELPEGYYSGLEKLSGLNALQGVYNIAYARLVSNPMFNEPFAKALGTNQGPFFDLATVSQALRQIDDFTPLTEEVKAQLATLSNPAFLEIAEARNNELLEKIEANKKKTGFTVNETGEVSNEDLFASIIAKFRGKAILVDFWATWCGPCIMANKEMAPMKEELKDQEIVYLYIAGDNSPQKTWENMIPDIHGEHFRLTKEQWAYLTSSFKISGIPTYIIVDREGNISYKTTGFPGVNKMKEELGKALAQK